MEKIKMEKINSKFIRKDIDTFVPKFYRVCEECKVEKLINRSSDNQEK